MSRGRVFLYREFRPALAAAAVVIVSLILINGLITVLPSPSQSYGRGLFPLLIVAALAVFYRRPSWRRGLLLYAAAAYFGWLISGPFSGLRSYSVYALRLEISPLRWVPMFAAVGLTLAARAAGWPVWLRRIGRTPWRRWLLFLLPFGVVFFLYNAGYSRYEPALTAAAALFYLISLDERDTTPSLPALFLISFLAIMQFVFYNLRIDRLYGWPVIAALCVPLWLYLRPVARRLFSLPFKRAPLWVLPAVIIIPLLWIWWFLTYKGFYHITFVPAFLQEVPTAALIGYALVVSSFFALGNELLFRGVLRDTGGRYPVSGMLVLAVLVEMGVHFLALTKHYPIAVGVYHLPGSVYWPPLLVGVTGVTLGLMTYRLRTVWPAVFIRFTVEFVIFLIMLYNRNFFHTLLG